MTVAVEFTNDRAIFALNQAVVIAVSQHMLFIDTLQSGDDLKLSDLVDGINVIEAFALILITLMNRINADIAGLIVGLWFTALPYSSGFRSRFC